MMTKRSIIWSAQGLLAVLLLAMGLVNAVFGVLALTGKWPDWPFDLTTVIGTALVVALIFYGRPLSRRRRRRRAAL
jgi:membrane protein implicated in regulation of membrane protease activity